MLTTEAIPLHENVRPGSDSEFLDEVLSICEKGKRIRADWVVTQANAVFSTVPSRTDSLPWGSYIVDLTKSEAAIFETYDPKHKNMIRRAIKGGVVVKTTTDVAAIYNNVRETMVRQNLLYFPSQSYLSELQRRLGDKITFHIALHDNRIQGSAVVVHNHRGGFYYYGGSIAEPFPGALTLMQYEIMKELKRKDVPVYDLMGARMIIGDDSKIEGIQRFKRRFASGMRSGYCFRRIINPRRHKMLNTAMKIYFVLKGSHYEGDVIDVTRRSEMNATLAKA
jgi:lipid II:glycine glycyltransferase (peptidoglycan interpeptide bridge formation enzyme)